MTSPAGKIAIGATLYFLLALSFYGLRLLAFPTGGGPIPLWFAFAKVLGEAATSVAPGFVVGWLSRERGLILGAAAGAIGALVSTSLILYLWSIPRPGVVLSSPSAEVVWRVILGVVLAALAASFTNAIGGIAGAAVRRRARQHEVAP
jgi:hypothetical protein